MRRHTLFRITALLLSMALAGCSSFGSLAPPKGNLAAPQEDGLIYYMPRRAFRITVTVDSTGKIETPNVTSTDALPDYSRRYVLKYRRNLVGTNHGVLAVNARGLLETSSSSTVSATATIATAIGNLAGTITAAAAADPMAPTAALSVCTTPGQVYSKIVYPEELGSTLTICDFTISGAIAPSGLKLSDLGTDTRRVENSRLQAGVFYKRDLPYIIKMIDKSGNSAVWLTYSPDQAPISFAPVYGGLFANGNTNLTISDGVVTQSDTSTDSEIVGILQIPANVLSGYFTAIGQIFTSKANNKAQENNLVANTQSLDKSRSLIDACRRAINDNDTAGKAGADLTAVIANIKAAC